MAAGCSEVATVVGIGVKTPMGTDRRVVLPGGLGISYADTGDPQGRVVLYLHGTPGSRMQVGAPVSDVATGLGLRLVAPDRPGTA